MIKKVLVTFVQSGPVSLHDGESEYGTHTSTDTVPTFGVWSDWEESVTKACTSSSNLYGREKAVRAQADQQD